MNENYLFNWIWVKVLKVQIFAELAAAEKND